YQDPQDYSQHSAYLPYDQGFHEELGSDGILFRSQGFPYPDLAGPFGYRHQHDVHQGYGRTKNGDDRDDPGSQIQVTCDLEDLVYKIITAAHAEVVLFYGTQSPNISEGNNGFLFGPLKHFLIVYADTDIVVDVRHGVDRPCILQWDQYPQVLIVSEGRTFFFKYPDHREFHPPDAYRFPQRIFILEYSACKGRTQNTDVVVVLYVEIVEIPSLLQLEARIHQVILIDPQDTCLGIGLFAFIF